MRELGWLILKGPFGSTTIKLVFISGGGLSTALYAAPLLAESVLAVNNPRGLRIPDSEQKGQALRRRKGHQPGKDPERLLGAGTFAPSFATLAVLPELDPLSVAW